MTVIHDDIRPLGILKEYNSLYVLKNDLKSKIWTQCLWLAGMPTVQQNSEIPFTFQELTKSWKILKDPYQALSRVLSVLRPAFSFI